MPSYSLIARLGLALAFAALPATAFADGVQPANAPYVVAQGYSYPPPPVYYPERHERRIYGWISGSEPFNVWLYQGPHVHLHQGTVINPTGITLQARMHVAVYGHWNDDGSYHADRIDVLPR
jgi:hypothetical protein